MPTPTEMREYKELVPDAPERFLSAWEGESKNRQALEKIQYESIAKEVRAIGVDRRIALIGGLVLAFVVLGMTFHVVTHDVDPLGVAAILTAGGGLVWAVRRSTKGRSSVDEPESHAE